ncbi:MAG: hypothetical protein A2Z20_12775 [Bdellovibrionales bacterium RBG_16_40_8]|nr:MAG: hypothetical protein A2Z20_12775 [Bdellovibrionales bacterium RBG_16_40_8]
MRVFFTSIVATILIISSFGWADSTRNNAQKIKLPHLDLDVTSQELRQLLMKQKPNLFSFGKPVSGPVEYALQIGERLLSWVDIINANRAKEDKLRLTSPQNRVSYPITAPNHYSRRTIELGLAAVKAQMPLDMRDILFGEAPLPNKNPITDEDFINFGRKVDRIYQSAARWTMLIQFKGIYIEARVDDIRGYYFLQTNGWNQNTLKNWPTIDIDTQAQIKEALIGICINARNSFARCKSKIDSVVDVTGIVNFYKLYIQKSAGVYKSFFEISNARRDIKWNKGSSFLASIPFLTPSSEEVKRYIKENIEDEYSWKSWGLKIDFINQNPAPYVVFTPGVVPHVEYIGGNKIEMDANASLDEYEVQWTIRHEFGHVLGFPDCYHEFFDEVNYEFINYQIDVNDLMCSRAGNFTQRIYDQLEASYMR